MNNTIYTSPHTSRIYNINLLVNQAISFWFSNKTVCLASLGIATVDGDKVMPLVVQELCNQSIYAESKLTTYSQWPECWAGSRILTYYSLTLYEKIAYCSIEKAPEKGFKELSCIVEMRDKSLRLAYNGLKLTEPIIDIPENMTASHIIAPEGAHIWLCHDGNIYWSSSPEGEKTLAMRYQ